MFCEQTPSVGKLELYLYRFGFEFVELPDQIHDHFFIGAQVGFDAPLGNVFQVEAVAAERIVEQPVTHDPGGRCHEQHNENSRRCTHQTRQPGRQQVCLGPRDDLRVIFGQFFNMFPERRSLVAQTD